MVVEEEVEEGEDTVLANLVTHTISMASTQSKLFLMGTAPYVMICTNSYNLNPLNINGNVVLLILSHIH
jgi:hypothetical protein